MLHCNFDLKQRSLPIPVRRGLLPLKTLNYRLLRDVLDADLESENMALATASSSQATSSTEAEDVKKNL